MQALHGLLLGQRYCSHHTPRRWKVRSGHARKHSDKDGHTIEITIRSCPPVSECLPTVYMPITLAYMKLRDTANAANTGVVCEVCADHIES